MTKQRVSILAALVLAVAVVAANVAVAHADDYIFGQVAALNNFPSTGYFAEVLTAGGTLTIAVDEDLWNRLEVGDTLVKSGETWALLNKRIGINGLLNK